MEKVIVITGPTGVGKTELSLKIASMYNGEIINADASQFKKDLNIGTAKIDINSVSVKHHLIDIIEATEMFSINDFQKEARLIIDKIVKDGKTPFLVGGTGLYINACLNEYHLDSSKHDLMFEEKYQDYSNEKLHDVLKEVDYNASLNIHCNNRRRVLRAIELALEGKSISYNIDGDKPFYDSLIICLNTDREILYDRINKRCKMMLEEGWIEECRSLKEKGIDLQKIKDIGYSDIDLYLNGDISIEQVEEIIAKKTRNYAKRQITWMKNKMKSVFVNIDYDDINNTIEEVKELVDNFLEEKN